MFTKSIPVTAIRYWQLIYFLSALQWLGYHATETEKDSIIEELKELGNGQTMLPYFAFFTEKDMKRRSFEESLSSRTEKIPWMLKDSAPTRSRAELNLLKAISHLRNDKNVWEITLMALLLEKLIEPEPPVARLPWWKGPERIYVSNIIKMFEGSSSQVALRDDVKSLMKSADEQQEMVESFQKDFKKKQHKKKKNSMKKKNTIPHIISSPTGFQPMTNEDVFRTWFSGGKEHHNRTRRSIPAKHVGDTVCVEEGSGINIHSKKQKLARLCGACVKDIDLGPKV